MDVGNFPALPIAPEDHRSSARQIIVLIIISALGAAFADGI